MGNYATLAEIREEGLTKAEASDALVNKRLNLISRRIEDWTGQFFEPREMTIRVNGTGTGRLLFKYPIISISDIYLLDGDNEVVDTIPTDQYRVYNRHLEGSGTPDDRKNPKIELISALRYPSLLIRNFPSGSQNIQVTGVFGYTEYDGVTAEGITPVEINHVTKLLVIRESGKLADWHQPRARKNLHRVTSETKEGNIYVMSRQEIGAFSGDPEIDRIIVRYKRVGIAGV